MKRIVIRTHGGFGNQIFQIFYALNRSTGEIIVNHDSRYSHGFRLAHCFEVNFKRSTTFIEFLICRSRGVKLLEKMGMDIPEVKLRNTIFLDGYFQRVDLYTSFNDLCLSQAINRLRDILGIYIQPGKNLLCHIRLTDFFKTDIERIIAARKRLLSLGKHTDFISDDDDLIKKDKLCQKTISERKLVHVETSGLSAESVFAIMSEYNKIESNNSTLAFWAAVLNGSELVVTNKNLNALYLKLKAVL